MMTSEQINEMADKAMTSLYNALMEGKVTSVQGMCEVVNAIYKYHKMHHSSHGATEEVDML